MISLRLCRSSIFTLVWSRDVTLNISLFIGAGSRSTKNIGSLFFVIFLSTLVTCRTEKPICSILSIPITSVDVDGCRLRITIQKALSS